MFASPQQRAHSAGASQSAARNPRDPHPYAAPAAAPPADDDYAYHPQYQQQQQHVSPAASHYHQQQQQKQQPQQYYAAMQVDPASPYGRQQQQLREQAVNPLLQSRQQQPGAAASPASPAAAAAAARSFSSATTATRALSPEAHDPAHADARLQFAFQEDLRAAQPLFTARQIATRHLQSAFQLHGGPRDERPQLYTNRMLTAPPRGRSAGVTASPVVVDYHDDTEHGRKTQRRLLLDRKQSHRDEAKAFVEQNGISILSRMENAIAAGNSDSALPGIMNRKNRVASPSSSHTHLQGMGNVKEGRFDASQLRYTRRVHPEQAHATNLTRSLLPVRKIKTPSAACLASPARSPRGVRRGPRHGIDTNRVLTPDMIPPSREPRLRSLRPTESLGQGMAIKDGAPQWEWKGGLRGDYWRNKPTDPFGGEP